MATLSLQNICVRFANQSVLNNLDLTLEHGDVVAIIGASGRGKSTLLRVAAGLIIPDSGQVIAPRPGHIGFVFQSPELLPWRTALRNVSLPLEVVNPRASSNLGTAATTLTSLGLSDSVNKFPHQLSLGMQMRCSLARAIVTDPELLLLDEPFAALDELMRRQILADSSELITRKGTTAVLVSHTVQEAAYLADRVYVLGNNGDLSVPIFTGRQRDNNPIARLESSELTQVAAELVRALESSR